MAGLSEIVATTYENREQKTGDSVADHIPLLFKMREKGLIKEISGGRVIYEDLLFAQNSYVQSIDPTEEIVLGYNQTITGFEYSPKIVVVPVVINALEKAQNQGEGQFKDLLKTRLQVAESSLQNKFEQMLQGDGTGTAGKDFAGIKAYITQADTGSIGGLSRVTVSAVRNVHVGALATWSNVATDASNIESRIRYVKNQLVRNTDKPSLLLCGATYFNYIGDAMSAKQRFVQDSKMAEAGFDNVVIEGLTAVLASGKSFSALARIGATEAYFLNPDTFALKMFKGYNMQPLPERVSVNQLVDVALTLAIGNLTMNNPALNGVLFES
jgi:hypothetical protein